MSNEPASRNEDPRPDLWTAGRVHEDAYRMAALEGDYETVQFRVDAEVGPGAERIESGEGGAEGAWVQAQVWVPRGAGEEAEKRLDDEDSPGRPVADRPICPLCSRTIRYRAQEVSSPFGTAHADCAERHRGKRPGQW